MVEREDQPDVRGDLGEQISLHSVVSAVNGYPVLAGVDLTVRRGEVVLVSGANGAGRTSLLRLIGGLLPVRSGQAWVLGHDLARDRRTHRAPSASTIGNSPRSRTQWRTGSRSCSTRAFDEAATSSRHSPSELEPS